MKAPLWFIALSLLEIGCRVPPENIPIYSPMDPAESLQTIRQRASPIRTVSAEGAITLIDQKNDSVRFDAAIVLAPPDRARMRAWKFGQAVLDLTVTPDSTWLFLPRRDGHEQQLNEASSQTGRALRKWLGLLSQGIVENASLVSVSNSQIVVTWPGDDELSVVCTIERSTLTPRLYRIVDPASRARFTLCLNDYQSIGDAVWPTRIEASSDTGRVIVQMRDVELNGTIADNALKPPARAERLP